MALKPRPLSPHLQIYKPLFTMMMSIVHRITGVALYFVTVGLVIGLVCLASGKENAALILNCLNSWFGKLLLIGTTWALFHHGLGGIRHFIWDTGRGFSPEGRELLAKLSLIGSIVLTALLWGALLLGK